MWVIAFFVFGLTFTGNMFTSSLFILPVEYLHDYDVQGNAHPYGIPRYDRNRVYQQAVNEPQEQAGCQYRKCAQ